MHVLSIGTKSLYHIELLFLFIFCFCFILYYCLVCLFAFFQENLDHDSAGLLNPVCICLFKNFSDTSTESLKDSFALSHGNLLDTFY